MWIATLKIRIILLLICVRWIHVQYHYLVFRHMLDFQILQEC